MSGKNELYEEAMKNSIKLREVIPGLTQEEAERVSLYYAIGYMESTPQEIEDAQAWQDQRWREVEGVVDAARSAMKESLEDSIENARKNGAEVFRYVFLVNGLTFSGEPMWRFKFIEAWEEMTQRPELTRAEYGTPGYGKFEYIWHTL
jgi:hypothetical protein